MYLRKCLNYAIIGDNNKEQSMENFNHFGGEQNNNNWEMGEESRSKEVQNLGNAAIESANIERAPAQYDGKSVKEKITELESWLNGRRNKLVSEVNDVWERIEDEGYNPSTSNEYKSKEQENKNALNDARNAAFGKLSEAFPGSLDSKEFGKIYGETVGNTGFLTRMEGFKHFSKEARLGVMEKFDFYNYAELFKEKGSDLYELIEEKVFGGELSDEDDMAWDIRAGTIADKNKEPVECIYIGQSFREEQYDDEGNYTGDQWFSSQGGIFINLSDFKDIRMSGRCSKEMKEQFERAKNTNIKNVQDLFEGGAEALVQ